MAARKRKFLYVDPDSNPNETIEISPSNINKKFRNNLDTIPPQSSLKSSGGSMASLQSESASDQQLQENAIEPQLQESAIDPQLQEHVENLNDQMKSLAQALRKKTRKEVKELFFNKLADPKKEEERQKKIKTFPIGSRKWEIVMANVDGVYYYFFHNKRDHGENPIWQYPRELDNNHLAQLLCTDFPRNALYAEPLRNLFLKSNAANLNVLLMEPSQLEQQLIAEFDAKKGQCPCYYSYLLIDSRIFDAESCSMQQIMTGQPLKLENFAKFLTSIFYVGKGIALRAFDHVTKLISKLAKDPFRYSPEMEFKIKSQKIKDIWDNGKGIIVLQPFLNMPEQEAYIREAAMILALGLDNLTNIADGHKGEEKPERKEEQIWNERWQNDGNLAKLGVQLLLNAFHQIGFSRIRPILREDAMNMKKEVKKVNKHPFWPDYISKGQLAPSPVDGEPTPKGAKKGAGKNRKKTNKRPVDGEPTKKAKKGVGKNRKKTNKRRKGKGRNKK